MIIKPSYFDFTNTRRYYHMIVFSIPKGVKNPLQDCWTALAIGAPAIESYEWAKVTIHRAAFTSWKEYSDSEEDNFSTTEEGGPPYRYDIFAVYDSANNYLALGFPFLALGNDLLDSLEKHIRTTWSHRIIKVLLDEFVLWMESPDPPIQAKFSLNITGLKFNLKNQQGLRLVNIGGDKPTGSVLFKKQFRSLVGSEDCQIKSCAVLGETAYHQDNNIPRTRAVVHFDTHGHFSFYLHSSGGNVFVIPFLLETLIMSKCVNTPK